MALASLTACSTFESITSSDKVDYRTQAKQTTGLDVPPDLTQLPKENRPTGPISAAQMATQPSAQRQTAATAGAPVALDKAGSIEFQRLGNARWLHSTRLMAGAVVIAVLAIPAAQQLNRALFDPQGRDPVHSLFLFDLMGIDDGTRAAAD